MGFKEGFGGKGEEGWEGGEGLESLHFGGFWGNLVERWGFGVTKWIKLVLLVT